MKSKPTQPNAISKPFGLTAVLASSMLLSVSGNAQEEIVIEGGPAEVRISDQDGKAEPVDPANTPTSQTIPVPLPAAKPNAVVIESVPGTETKLVVPTEKYERKVDKVIMSQPSATAPVSTAPDQISVEKQKELSKIKRELEIAESATAARAVLEADDVFDEKTRMVEETAKPTLKKLAEFMELSPKDSATIHYKYVPTEESESEARLRASELVEYLSRNAGAVTTEFTIEAPEPVKVEIPEEPSTTQFVTTRESLIEITLQ